MGACNQREKSHKIKKSESLVDTRSETLKMKKIWLVFLISSNTSATQLTLNMKDSVYKIEYNPKTYTIKILSKKNATKECDKETKSSSTKILIQKQLRNSDKKVIKTFRCIN